MCREEKWQNLGKGKRLEIRRYINTEKRSMPAVSCLMTSQGPASGQQDAEHRFHNQL